MFSSTKFLVGAALTGAVPASPGPDPSPPAVWKPSSSPASAPRPTCPTRSKTSTPIRRDIEINAVNTEDMLKYVPSIVVRKRHYGDTQDPLATRTSGVGASARSLLFVDGILISSPIGNNNTYASPHFGIAQPEDISNFQVIYGPFAAEYARRLDRRGAQHHHPNAGPFHASMPMRWARCSLSRPICHQQHLRHLAIVGGHRRPRRRFFLAAVGQRIWIPPAQPLSYVTLTRPSAPSAAGTPVTGAFNDLNRTNTPIVDDRRGRYRKRRSRTPTRSSWHTISAMAGRRLIPPASSIRLTMPRAETYLRDAHGRAGLFRQHQYQRL